MINKNKMINMINNKIRILLLKKIKRMMMIVMKINCKIKINLIKMTFQILIKKLKKWKINKFKRYHNNNLIIQKIKQINKVIKY